MDTIHSKTALVYRTVKRDLRSGRYAPGQRIDPARLAADFNISHMPIRLALYRLVGELRLADHARDGLHVPLLTEVELVDLYDWMEHLLLAVCDIDTPTSTPRIEPLEFAADDDLVNVTWLLFERIARRKRNWSLHRAVKHANDLLAPIRYAKQGLLENVFEELSELNQHWQTGDIPALKSALHDYHERRKRLVPCIVALLNERAGGPH